jgi:hypothetical protein
MRYAWTQPACGSCYSARHPGREPVTVNDEYRQAETCAVCGTETLAGIYIRVDPATVAHPTRRDA